MLIAESLPPTFLDALYFAKYGLVQSGMANRMLSKMDWAGTSYGYSITNVGRVDILAAYGPRLIEAVYGPFLFSDVNEKVVGVTTVGDRMTFALTCNRAIGDAGVAAAIRDASMARLLSRSPAHHPTAGADHVTASSRATCFSLFFQL